MISGTRNKVLVCRYDGAYRDNNAPVPEPCRVDAVRRFRRDGGVFGVITERDASEIMAILGVFEGEVDFVLCCSGGCLITYSVPGEAASPVTGLRLAAVGERGALPVLAYRYGVQPHVLCTLHGVFAGAGMTYMNADTPGFRGGVGMGMDYLKRYSPESEGLGCKIHFWYDGSQYFDNYVSAEALRHVFPVSQARVYFSGNAVAQGAAAFAKNAFGDGIALHMDDCGFRITSPFADYVYGVRRYMHLAGIEDADVWAVGYMAEDAALMKEFCGIAIEGSPAEKTGTARYTVSDVTEAVQITEKEAL